MPIYTYRCAKCGVEFDQHQNFSDLPLVKCPECGKKSLRKVFSPTGIIFKGSGWYATDHRSPSGRGAGTKEKKESPPEKTGADAPAETPKKKESSGKGGD
jgi:putative FmdB family regulatory protein